MHLDCDGAEIVGVGRFTEGGDGGLQLLGAHPAVSSGDFFQASDLEALVMFDGADELGGFQERGRRQKKGL